MDLLLRCKRAVGPTTAMSFGDVGREILGPKGKLLIDVFLVGMQLGICCVYFTFVATNIHVVLPEKCVCLLFVLLAALSRDVLTPRASDCCRLQSVIHERQLILAIFPVLLLLSWVRTLKRITPFSGLGAWHASFSSSCSPYHVRLADLWIGQRTSRSYRASPSCSTTRSSTTRTRRSRASSLCTLSGRLSPRSMVRSASWSLYTLWWWFACVADCGAG